MDSINTQHHKKVVVFIMGATGTGKSRLSVAVAAHFQAEIINSDKIQVYKGLDIVTNKVSELEKRGVPHHLLGEVDPDSDFTATDFCFHALSAIEWIVKSGRVPVIVGGSNSYIEALVEDPSFNFKAKYEPCFIWVDVSLPVLYKFVSQRVDQMVHAGLVEEVRGVFVEGADYSRGIRRAIGVPEMDMYFKKEKQVDEETKRVLLEAALAEIKINTFKLACCQLGKIQRLREELGWAMHRLDATSVFQKSGEEAEQTWVELVLQPSLDILNGFFTKNKKKMAPVAVDDHEITSVVTSNTTATVNKAVQVAN